MSSGNIDFELQNTLFRNVSSVPVALLNFNDSSNRKVYLLGYVSGAPATTATSLTTPLTWAGGAIIFDVGNGIAYTNAGFPSVPSWVVISKSA